MLAQSSVNLMKNKYASRQTNEWLFNVLSVKFASFLAVCTFRDLAKGITVFFLESSVLFTLTWFFARLTFCCFVVHFLWQMFKNTHDWNYDKPYDWEWGLKFWQEKLLLSTNFFEGEENLFLKKPKVHIGLRLGGISLLIVHAMVLGLT